MILQCRKAFVATTLALALVIGQAQAADAIQIESIHYAPSTELQGHTLVLNGAALRKKLFFKVYAAGLYVQTPTHNVETVLSETGPARVRLGLLRDVSGESFIEALDDGLKANLSPEKEKSLAAELDKLRSIMKLIGDVKINDLVDFDYSPTVGTTVNHNGKLIGGPIGGGRDLYNAVLAIWLGENTIDKKLKTGMLGL